MKTKTIAFFAGKSGGHIISSICFTAIGIFVILCTHSTLLAMDMKKTRRNDMDIGKIISKIDTAIYEKYTPCTWLNLCDPVEERDFVNITKLAKQDCPNELSNVVFDALYQNNHLFKRAIDHFVALASYHLEIVTTDTIDNIEELNKLTFQIKAYIMQRALQQIKYRYDIVLKDQHMNDIVTFDICELTHQAATASSNSYTMPNPTEVQFILWDLKTSKVIRIFNESVPITILAFNPDGSRIAGAMNRTDTIKIWCTKTGQALHTLFHAYPVKNLLHSYENIIPVQSAATGNIQAGQILNPSYVINKRNKDCSFIGLTYQVIHHFCSPIAQKTELHVTKKACASLYLCLQAIKNTRYPKIESIEYSMPYQNLTDLEKKMVFTEINKKSITQKAQ